MKFRGVALWAGLAIVAVGGCSTTPQVKEIDDQLFADHFMAACQQSVEADHVTTTIEQLATSSQCQCVLDDLLNAHRVTLDAVKDYESKLSELKDGDTPPEPPSELVAAIDRCRSAVETTTTTEAAQQ